MVNCHFGVYTSCKCYKIRMFWKLDSADLRSSQAWQGYVLDCLGQNPPPRKKRVFCSFLPDDENTIQLPKLFNFIIFRRWAK
jgi:hypothetical protein